MENPSRRASRSRYRRYSMGTNGHHMEHVRRTAGSKFDRFQRHRRDRSARSPLPLQRQRPENVSRDRCVAEPVVAGLIAEARRYLHSSDWRCRRNIEPNTDRELVLEYQQRLRLADLIELGRRRENDLADGHSLWRVHGQNRWNKRRVSRRIRLDVKPLRNSNLESGADRRTRRRIRLHERRQLCLDSAEAARQQSAMKPAAARLSRSARARLSHRLEGNVGGAPSICTLCPFTGGTSWYRKSHFQRSDGLDACSQFRAGTGRVKAPCPLRRSRGQRGSDGDSDVAATVDRGATDPGTAQRCKDLPVFHGLSGWGDGLRRALHHPLVVRVDRVLFDPCRTRQNDVRSRCQF